MDVTRGVAINLQIVRQKIINSSLNLEGVEIVFSGVDLDSKIKQKVQKELCVMFAQTRTVCRTCLVLHWQTHQASITQWNF